MANGDLLEPGKPILKLDQIKASIFKLKFGGHWADFHKVFFSSMHIWRGIVESGSIPH